MNWQTFLFVKKLKMNTERVTINVGILSSKKIKFQLNQDYLLFQTGKTYFGTYVAKITPEHKILFDNETYSELKFTKKDSDSNFTLYDVIIGKNFHWQQKEDQKFEDNLKFIVEDNNITAINIIDVESYLKSVISSEMRATSSLELLKAHAVISRSWVISQIRNKKIEKNRIKTPKIGELIKWYDREDHKNFDVCADDHCQRYQGITKESTNSVKTAIEETLGEVLTSDGKICDARFSKCCGGVTELFENCWEDTPHKYLTEVIDNKKGKDTTIGDLTQEKDAQSWIEKESDSFCNTTDKNILKQVLNDYDQKTPNFYRWKVEYDAKEIQTLIENKTGIEFGTILDLQPIERGVSGRLIKLNIIGEKKTLVVGKELEIRRVLSETHLYSSAFVINKVCDTQKNVTKFILKGAGWGHGVGLCQIGAAVMSENGYKYDEILLHYYKNSLISHNYGL